MQEILKNIGILSSMPFWVKLAILVIGNATIILLCWGPRSKSDAEEKTNAGINIEGNTFNAPGATFNIHGLANQSVRVKFSSRQTVRDKFDDPSQVLNLDNIATMHLFSCGETSVEFLLSTNGSISVPKPQSGKNYPIGGGRKVVTDGGITVSDMVIVSGAGELHKFDLDHRTRRIAVGGRAFSVRLDGVNQSGKNPPEMEYVFAISEE
jgi:hypothetical protein